MYERSRNLVRRADDTLVNVARPRGHLFVCHEACCCGRTEDGFAPVPTKLYESEWQRRRLRNFVHLTIGGCLGPCALANVAMLLWEGQTLWFQSLNSDALVVALFDHIQGMLEAGEFLPPAEPLAGLLFTASNWQPRPDGQPVEDQRAYHGPGADELDDSRLLPEHPFCTVRNDDAPDRRVADMGGPAAMPRKNGELIFAAPWEGRAFGMAIALSEEGRYDWSEFRDGLIAQISAAEAGGDRGNYYERWLAALESLLADKGVLTAQEIDERAYQFEFGERDEIF